MNDGELEKYICGDYVFEILHDEDDSYEVDLRKKNEFNESYRIAAYHVVSSFFMK